LGKRTTDIGIGRSTLIDRENGIFADSQKVHEIHHDGEFFKVRGPLNIPRSPQKRPVLIQAGTSEDGREFSSQYADAIFTSQQTFEDARVFYKDVKERIARNGRILMKSKYCRGLVLLSVIRKKKPRKGKRS
jgi:alkanesulfonate monooxygenase SsuD/methylene tetrahydromethanopterin reductase-like flavin-dependent oxidoreductase (luciferase family)